MITGLDAAKLCQESYDEKSSWDKWYEIDGIVAGVKYFDGYTVLVFRGSDCPEDWRRDISILPTYHRLLGFVHSGFIEGMDHFYDHVRRDLKGDIILTGHSLGASRASLMAGLLIDARVSQMFLFGCPRPGFSKCRKRAIRNCDSIQSFHNRADPVTKVPYLLGLYKHIVNPVKVDSKVDTLNPFDDHFIEQYIAALQS